MSRLMLVLAILCCACGITDPDFDGDGVNDDEDCAPADPDRHPGATEIPDDGIDQDCDGSDQLCDADEDGAMSLSCGGQDCDDADANCSDLVGCADQDRDGVRICDGDCDDENPAIAPGSTEDCDGLDTTCVGTVPQNEIDADVDGYRPCEGDCDDSDPTISPGVPEQCNGVDDDCDGALTTEEEDDDGDGWPGCLECDDADATTHPSSWKDARPGGEDGVDSNCDGSDRHLDVSGGVTIHGAFPDDALGRPSRGGGDLDGDALPELLARFDGISQGLVVPAIAVFRGDDLLAAVEALPIDVGVTTTFLASEGADHGLGASVAFLPDASGGSELDVALGAPRAGDAGRVYLTTALIPFPVGLGQATVEWNGADPGEGAGTSLAALELDVGLTSLAIGAPCPGCADGSVYILRADTVAAQVAAMGTHALASADLELTGGSGFGSQLATIPDVDGDDLDELAVTDPDTGDGCVHVFTSAQLRGSSPLPSSAAHATICFTAPGPAIVIDAGRISDDTLGDLVLGREDAGVFLMDGAVIAAGGAPTTAAASFVLEGPAGSGLGAAVLVADLDNDGRDDIATVAPGDDDEGPDAGITLVVLGSTASTTSTLSAADADLRIHGTSGATELGLLPDLDGDGAPELVTGSEDAYGPAGANVGVVHIQMSTGLGD